MKTFRQVIIERILSTLTVAAVGLVGDPAVATPAKATPDAARSTSIPADQIGVVAGQQYTGDGLSVSLTPEGARLRCVFQKLEGEVTTEGLWLFSTVDNAPNERFRVVATSVGRKRQGASNANHHTLTLANTGQVEVTGQIVRFIRPGLLEEYSVSVDGVRQDFVVAEKPPLALAPAPSNGESVSDHPGEGALRVELAVTGARIEPLVTGARLVLDGSGRKLAYSRLRVTDATGKELIARMQAIDKSPIPDPQSEIGLAVLVDDEGAVYPVRIDPTFSDANWISMGTLPGTDGEVYAAALDDAGNLYIGGSFTVVGDVVAKNIAMWDGSNWSALGSGIGSIDYHHPAVWALAASGSTLYAGGDFTTAGELEADNIAQWDGGGWSALGSGMNAPVYALAVSGSTLYAGGGFTTAGGVEANSIAQWDGNSWWALGSGIEGAVVSALAVSGRTLYAGGNFTTAGGVAANRIAQWDGSEWSALGSGVEGDSFLGPHVGALAVSGSMLYAGGWFTTAGGVDANNIAQWDGSEWSALGSGINGAVYVLAASGSTLNAGGNFTTADGVAAYIAQWDGSRWSALGSGMNAPVSALVVSGSTLYAGGSFTSAGGEEVNRIVQWDGSRWSALGPRDWGLNAAVSALTVSGSTLYAGGDFTTAGGVTANYIAQWDGSNWSALGSGMRGAVYALAVSGTTLYAGGWFTTAGVVAVNSIAQWNGNGWSGLGSGVSGEVYALAVSGSTLYAGGSFTHAGGVAATNIAEWDGSNWSALGSGMGGAVYALAVSGTTLYAGGWFTTAGGVEANSIAQWDGNSWSALGSGMSGSVHALAVSGTTLYAGGQFTNAGGVAVNSIAQWDGNSWSGLGSGMGGAVYALAVSGTTLYAGGWFTTAGGVEANSIAQWDGNSWSGLGSGISGMNRLAWALAVSGSTLYAGGEFATAGGKMSVYMARAILVPNPTFSATVLEGSNLISTGTGGIPGSTYYVLSATNAATPMTDWVRVATNTFGVSGTFGVTNAVNPARPVDLLGLEAP